MSKKIGRHFKEETNSSADRKARRKLLDCSFCRPHRGENQVCRRCHGTQKPKYKNHRRSKYLHP